MNLENMVESEKIQTDENAVHKDGENKRTDSLELHNETPPEFEQSRPKWGSKWEFLMSCIATSVGLGNIWRFPFTAYTNGGGAFLIPYIIVLIVVGKPFYYLEAALGQFSSRSIVQVWSVTPAMKGVGWGHMIAAFWVLSYYCSLMALTIYYLFASFSGILPWSYCREEWGDSCVADSSVPSNSNTTERWSSAELYFRRIVLQEADSIVDGIGIPSWQLSLCLAFSWLCIFLVQFRGVKSAGKAAYFLALFPYAMMIILLIRAVTLEGAGEGILFFLTPKWDKLLEPTVWYAAITQCFFSLTVCLGAIIMFSSYNGFRHTLYRDVMIVTTLDTFTSIMAGCTVFGIMGNLAYETNATSIDSVVRSGSGLAFISYPEALARFPAVPQLFSALFFIMMFVLGVGSGQSLVGVISSAITDRFSKLKQIYVVAVIVIIGFFLGLIYCTPGGQWILTLVDFYSGNILTIVGVVEVVTIFWIYGLTNFLNDMEFMVGYRPGIYWRACWFVITPVLMITVVIYTFIVYEDAKYDGQDFPPTALGFGWAILGTAVAQIGIWIIWNLIQNRSSSFRLTLSRAFRPSHSWGPKDPITYREWEAFKEEKKQKSPGGIVNFFFG
ncbi:sodium-dependent nutrient amino acid transporter 1-like [Athalia rosae]|uniref:sodium-dependent nutrient amino acid transporter 1-like n=1 Tax=Athalia rosae TaxID=37344 RepID=UPI002033316A|nr:sodium-dependent nutrient amino acid transporter 1-like [Athalia rosae]